LRDQGVGGSTVHFAMVSLRFRPEWFKARSKLGYGADWPLASERRRSRITYRRLSCVMPLSTL